VQKAVELAGDWEVLAEKREGLRGRLQASPVMDPAGFARRFEAVIGEMVRLKKAR
jgi:predicted O-linked N-acetylglucosamine transferase (SPINDLY family)